MAVSTATVPAAAATAPGAPPATAGAAPRPVGTVSLLTGDRVGVHRIGTRMLARVTPGAGRGGITFLTRQYTDERGVPHLDVIPSDAVPLLRDDRVDGRLFDVAGLLRQGYGDADRPDLPVMVQGAAAGSAVRRGGGSGGVALPGAVATRQPKATAGRMWRALTAAPGDRSLAPGLRKIWLDGRRGLALDRSVPQIGAPDAWAAGWTGKGVKVAVLDSGIDARHGDFEGRLLAVRDFTETRPDDLVGHGTHVASTIAGTGARSGARYKGAAPDADLMIGKVCPDDHCSESAVLAGMSWAATSGADIVNLSLGAPDTPGEDLLEQTVDSLSDKYGLLFVVAAGNDGSYGDETVSSPASADAALAVGAVDKSDALAPFSARGPRFGDAALKPDLVAPGVSITAARAGGVRGGAGPYTAMSGTSMAAAHVSGAAALLAQRHPDWPGDRLKAALMSSARPPAADGDGYAQGAGRVDALRAVSQDVLADPGGLSAGRFAWPHDDDKPADRTLTYRNAAASAVTLSLALDTLDPAGRPAPEGMFTLSATSVTVPAGGTATVTVRVAPSAAGPDGHYTGRVTATAGTARITTPVVADKEPESYDLAVVHTDRAGRPAAAYSSFLYGIDQRRYRVFRGGDGIATVRVRPGRYHLDGTVYTPRNGGAESDVARVVQPVVDVRRDTAVVLDARAAKPVSVTFDRAGVEPSVVGLGYLRLSAGGALVTGLIGGGFDDVFTGSLGDPAPDRELIADVGGMWVVPGRGGDHTRAAVTYNLQWFEYGSLPSGFARHVADDPLAQVTVRYRTQGQNKFGLRQWIGAESTVGYGAGYGTGFRLPVTRTEFHNVDGLVWKGHFRQYGVVDGAVTDETELAGGPVEHAPGGRYEEEWNGPVFGPGLPGPGGWVERGGDQITARIPLFSDAGTDRAGFSEVASGRTALYRDGTLVGERPAAGPATFDVPAADAAYRLEAEATRSGVSRFSTRTRTVWTFRSQHTDGWRSLPLSAVRFAPPGLDDQGAAPGDAPVEIPVTVQRQRGAPPGEAARLGVEASFDDGRTWQRLTPSGSGAAYKVTVPQPPGATFVSLRATSADGAGNTVEQTIVRAYAL
ncbi:S8 family serine peptidase [Spirillospora sp. CA-294931]|uniref:S8 family serine peptidase n=1 Tax=Spirillospora sp. CA-294931 TaxID=3240042 RepID=UPI003D8AA1C0